MASESPRSPKLVKGGLAVYPSQDPGPPPQVIIFQYNPEQMSRSLAMRAAPRDPGNVGAAREDVLRVEGPPVETITLSVELDAADQLAEPAQNPVTVENGLHPVLATLEMLLYPTTEKAQRIMDLAQQGQVQVCPADVPLVLLVWGKSRVLPVMLTSFSVTEQAFDANLNPIQAKVDLGMRVLTYMELKQGTVGYMAFLAYQRQKEMLAGKYQPLGDASRFRGLLPM
ncbi:MAG: hypothetical protein ACM3SW_18265 [Actinomycetota bacterium]